MRHCSGSFRQRCNGWIVRIVRDPSAAEDLHAGLRSRSPLSIGAHGSLLPFVIILLGLTLGSLLGVIQIDQDGVHAFQAVRLPSRQGHLRVAVVVVVYYLVWKYIVAFLNDLVGID